MSQCPPLPVQVFDNGTPYGCTDATTNGTPCGTVMLSLDNTCMPMPPTCAPVVGPLALTTLPVPTMGGMCAPQPSWKTPDAWRMSVLACVAPADTTGCSGAELCLPPVPSADAGPSDRICILSTGGMSCTAPGYPASFEVYENGDFVDNRLCTGCTCGPADGGTCTAALEVFDGGCANAGPPTDAGLIPADCVVVGTPGSLSAQRVPLDQGGCAVTDAGSPDGGVVITGSVQFCCTQ